MSLKPSSWKPWTSVVACVFLTLFILFLATIFWSSAVNCWGQAGQCTWGLDLNSQGGSALVTLIVTTVGGLGGVVALVVAYRKQRDAEDNKLADQFQTALHNLGHDKPQVRIAGVHELVEIADKHIEYIEKVVNVLCGYLRSKIPNDAPVQDTILKQIRIRLLLDKKTS